jgi:hypothetical protein
MLPWPSSGSRWRTELDYWSPRRRRLDFNQGRSEVRKRDSYIKEHGKEVGSELYHLLQKRANLGSQLKKNEKKLEKFRKKHGI